MNPKVSVIYVNYKSSEDLLESINSLINSKSKVSYEIIVIDNSLKDVVSSKLKKLKKKVLYIKPPSNIGYGAGNNLGAAKASGKYLFILNPDTRINKHTIDILSKFLVDNDKVAIIAPNLVKENSDFFENMGSSELTPIRAIFSLSFVSKLLPQNRFLREYFLKDKDFEKLREVVAVPGSAFMIRKSVFEEVGRFDENIFMYFEEADLGKRVKEEGYKTYINPKAGVIHKWQQNGDKPEKLKRIFGKSRFYYFRKHFGLINALLVEIFTRFSILGFMFFMSLLLGLYLRFSELNRFVRFSGDTGYYFILARDIFTKGRFPLVSIATSVPVFRQGAIFIWILGIVLNLFDYNPVYAFYFTALINYFALVFFYFVIKEIFGENISSISTVIACFSPLLISHSRRVSVTSPIFLFTIISMWLFKKAIYKKSMWYYFFLGITLSILFQFELAAFTFFIIYALTFVIVKKKVPIKDVVYTLFGILIGVFPFIIYDIKNGVFIQTVGFLIWVVMKPFENIFFASSEMSPINYNAGLEMISHGIVAQAPAFSMLILGMGLVVFFKVNKSRIIRMKPEIILILLWFLITHLSFLARGIFSDAYMPFTFIPTLIIISYLIYWILEKSAFLGYLLLLLLITLNLLYVLNTNFLMGESNKNTLKHKIAAANYIINDSSESNYKLIYAGGGDMYESGGSNYQYLLWWLGKEPVNRADIAYKIVDRGSVEALEEQEDTVWIGDISIIKLRR